MAKICIQYLKVFNTEKNVDNLIKFEKKLTCIYDSKNSEERNEFLYCYFYSFTSDSIVSSS